MINSVPRIVALITVSANMGARAIMGACTYEKVHLHIQFPHALSTLHCNFLLLTLIDQNQGKL